MTIFNLLIIALIGYFKLKIAVWNIGSCYGWVWIW